MVEEVAKSAEEVEAIAEAQYTPPVTSKVAEEMGMSQPGSSDDGMSDIAFHCNLR